MYDFRVLSVISLLHDSAVNFAVGCVQQDDVSGDMPWAKRILSRDLNFSQYPLYQAILKLYLHI